MGLDFLPLKGDFLDKVIEIEALSFPQPWTRAMFEREVSLPISNFFIAVLDGVIIGYGGYWRVEDEAHLVSLAVHPKFRSKGFGRRILEFLARRMKEQKLNKILLEVRKNNLTAIGLYKSYGFTASGVREKYYNNAEDAVLMEKKLHDGGHENDEKRF